MNQERVKSSRRHVVTASPSADVVFGFEELEVYQAVRAFRKRINALTALLPPDERFRLKAQMKKAALSLTNAIAEGHGRYTYKDRKHYCYEARGSLQELVDDINECNDSLYAKPEHLKDLRCDAFRTLQLIDGWARWLESQHQAKLKEKKNQKPPSAPPKTDKERNK